MKSLFAALALVVAINQPSFAAEKGVDFTQAILDQDDKPIFVMECVDSTDLIVNAAGAKECRETKRVGLTLGVVAQRALNLPEQGLDPTQAQMRGQLALNVYRSADAQITADEVALIKKQVAKMYSPIVSVRAAAILDPNSVKDRSAK